MPPPLPGPLTTPASCDERSFAPDWRASLRLPAPWSAVGGQPLPECFSVAAEKAKGPGGSALAASSRPGPRAGLPLHLAGPEPDQRPPSFPLGWPLPPSLRSLHDRPESPRYHGLSVTAPRLCPVPGAAGLTEILALLAPFPPCRFRDDPPRSPLPQPRPAVPGVPRKSPVSVRTCLLLRLEPDCWRCFALLQPEVTAPERKVRRTTGLAARPTASPSSCEPPRPRSKGGRPRPAT